MFYNTVIQTNKTPKSYSLSMEKIRSPIIVTIGHIDHGKCLHPSEKVILADGRIVKIKDLVENFKGKESVISTDGSSLFKSRINFAWKIFINSFLYEIETELGDKIKVTPEHPFLTKDGWVSCESIFEGDRIAIPLRLPIDVKNIEENTQDISINSLYKIPNYLLKKLAKNILRKFKYSDYSTLLNLKTILLRVGILCKIKRIRNKWTLVKVCKKRRKELKFVRIIRKRKIPYKGFVYDLTIPHFQNFIANNVIVHNTTLLDKIRGTSVCKSEPGQITQHVGASYVPLEIIEKICGNLLEKFKVKLEVPGLLFIDTPGHAAFTSLRKRGGSVADLAILVIDVNEGFKEQTDESLFILKQFKVPFVVAATKIDKIPGWIIHENECFIESFKKQPDYVKEELEKKIYFLISQFIERGFEAERFDKVKDFKKQVAIVPVSGITGEGVPELLMVLAGLAQKFLKDRLKLSGIARGSVLEVKEERGLGTTIDVILYDGSLRRGDYLVIGMKEPLVTKIRALLLPRPLQEIRVEKKFVNVEEVRAAAGVKIFAPNLDRVIAGSPFIAVRREEDIEKAKSAIKAEVEKIEFSKSIEGVIVRADTLGSLEAMLKMLSEKGIEIRKAEVGPPKKEDLIEMKNFSDRYKKVIFAFNVKVPEDIKAMAKDFGVKLIEGNIIYRIVEEYEKWVKEEREREIKEKLEMVTRPVKVKVLKGCIFRSSKPCIVGVEVLAGYLKPKVSLQKLDGKFVGKIKEIQVHGESIQKALPGDKVAISMDEPVAGRTFKEGDILVSILSKKDLELLEELKDKITESEKELLEEFKKRKLI